MQFSPKMVREARGPTMLDIARDMEQLCPNAILLNYTNPMAMLCRAIQQETKVKATGLCHSVQGTAAMLARWIGAPQNAHREAATPGGLFKTNIAKDLTFEKGKVVKASAGKGQDLLNQILDTDPGGRLVGEIAVGTMPATIATVVMTIGWARLCPAS